MYVAWCVVHVAMCAAHDARMFDVAWCADMLHRSVALYETCLRGQWDSPCSIGMLHVASCTLSVACVRAVCCTLHAVGYMP
jgi:hypothetical protein